MAISRYKNVQIVRNVDDNYKTVFSSRFPYNGIKQYERILTYENLHIPYMILSYYYAMLYIYYIK